MSQLLEEKVERLTRELSEAQGQLKATSEMLRETSIDRLQSPVITDRTGFAGHVGDLKTIAPGVQRQEWRGVLDRTDFQG